MATIPTKPNVEAGNVLAEARMPGWPLERGRQSSPGALSSDSEPAFRSEERRLRPAGGDALQGLLAFSALHQQVRQRRALASGRGGFETIAASPEFERTEQFVLDEVLQMVAERAIAITGADGLGIALAENNEIVLRASAGTVKPDVGARIQRDSAFSGACFRTAQIIRCDDTETDDRVNLYACRQLGARSMVAVPLCGRRRVIGLLEAFSAEPFGFNDSDVGSLELLAELILAALKPEDEDRFAESALAAEVELAAPVIPVQPPHPIEKAVENKIPTVSFLDKSALENKIEAAISPIISDHADVAVSLPASTETTALPEPSQKTNLALDVAPVVEAEVEVSPETTAGATPEKVAEHHPGVLLVLILVVVATLLGGGLWWKLKNAQLSEMVVQPEAKMAKPATTTAAPPSPSITTTPSVPGPGNIQNPATTGATIPSGVETPAQPAPGTTSVVEPGKLPRITGIRHWSAADSSTVVLDLEDQVQYEAHRLANPDRIYFDLHDTALTPELAGKSIEIGDALLSRIRIAQPVAGSTRVVLETRGNSDFSVSLEPNPYRLVVQLRKQGATPKAEINLFPGTALSEHPKLAIVVPPPSHEDLQLRARVPKMRIVVDAGHGGWDLGTVGRGGLLEKDLVLEIAQRLGKLLESRLGADVILTRNDDNYIPLDERAEVANHSQADLFVSVHANYSDLPSARGVETYYTNFFTAPNAKDIETRPGTASIKNSGGALLSPADLHDRIEQSRRLAASVQRSLYGTLSVQNPGLRDRGVKEASYVVLTETAMPGILAEVSFVSSPTDEQKLRSDGYREQIAEALYRGIARYAVSSRGLKMASAAK